MNQGKRLALCAALVGVLMVMAPVSFATTYTITVSTDASAYTSGQSIKVSGTITPSPGPSTAVLIRICLSSCKPATPPLAVGEAAVGATSGKYNFTFVAGGSSSWTTGTYSVNATWGAYQPTISKTSSFTYTAPVTTTTSTTTSTSSATSTSTSTTSSTSSSTTTSSSSTSTTSSTSIISTTSTSSSSSSTSSAAVPEFPPLAPFVAVLVVVVVVAYLLTRRAPSRLSASPTPS